MWMNRVKLSLQFTMVSEVETVSSFTAFTVVFQLCDGTHCRVFFVNFSVRSVFLCGGISDKVG